MASSIEGPFDRLRLSHVAPSLRLMISSATSFIMEIPDKTLRKIIQCNQFAEINILFSPTNDANVRDRILSLGVQPTALKRNGTEIYLDDLFLCCFNETSDLYGYEENGNLRLIDSLCYIYTQNRRMFDYFVVSSHTRDQMHNKEYVISTEDVLEYIRLYFLQQESFYVTPSYTIDETLYYMYRPRKQFHEYQRLWDHVITQAGIASPLADWSCALINRLEFFCRSSDALKIESLKKANNTTNSRIRYHLFELIICITGIFDNLSWILATFFSISIDKHQVSLRQARKENDTEDSQKSKFVEQLSKKSSVIANYLCEKHVKEFIRLVYPLRDEFVHREAPESCTLSFSSQSNSVSLIQLSHTAAEQFTALDRAGVP